MHGKIRLLSPGKASSHSIARRYPAYFSCVQCFRVSKPPAMMPTLLRQMDMGSLTCAQIWVRIILHTKGSQAQTSVHKSWLGQGIEPRVFGFDFRFSNHWSICVYVCQFLLLTRIVLYTYLLILHMIPTLSRHVTSNITVGHIWFDFIFDFERPVNREYYVIIWPILTFGRNYDFWDIRTIRQYAKCSLLWCGV